MIKCRITRLLEIQEGKLMQFARQVAGSEERFDEILGPVGRAGIADDPAVDVVGHRSKAALKVRRLVLDDHVEAEALAACHLNRRLRAAVRHAAPRLVHRHLPGVVKIEKRRTEVLSGVPPEECHA
ncbi:hypothetical protein NKI51_27710 [Mesorhizobium australicum]|uniref:hypothetical protein n=1 Tax=Mesorhizobium australicum TaxID=536018 RepID=UPI00333B8307